MIALGWDNEAMVGVLPMAGGFLTDDGLGTCLLISLFTDRRADAEEGLPAAERRGWVGDALSDLEGDRYGSHLWLLKRDKESEETRLRAEEYAAAALQWMLDDGVATSIEVEAQWVARGVLGLRVTCGGGRTAAPYVFQLRVDH